MASVVEPGTIAVTGPNDTAAKLPATIASSTAEPLAKRNSDLVVLDVGDRRGGVLFDGATRADLCSGAHLAARGGR